MFFMGAVVVQAGAFHGACALALFMCFYLKVVNPIRLPFPVWCSVPAGWE